MSQNIEDDEVYFQTTGFTCGPSILMTGMAKLDPHYTPSLTEEMTIWREANLVFMGKPPPGCGPYGLANAALRRNFKAEIFEHEMDDVNAAWALGPHEAEVQRIINERDHAEIIKQGGTVTERSLTREFMKQHLAEDKKLLVLVHHVADGHWVMLKDINGDEVEILDPHKATPEEARANPFLTSTGKNEMSYDKFEEWIRFGPRQSTVMLAISK